MTLPAEVVAYLSPPRVIAVVGLSSNPARPSHGVSRYMQSQGFRIIPVNPAETQVLGEAAFASLEEIPSRLGPIEIVDVFRRSEYIPEVVEGAIRVGARLLWLQEGVTHPAAEHMARAAGLLVVSDRCILKEHYRLNAARRQTAG